MKDQRIWGSGAWCGDPVDPPCEGEKLVLFLLQRKLLPQPVRFKATWKALCLRGPGVRGFFLDEVGTQLRGTSSIRQGVPKDAPCL